ncbi:hypothetical protein T4D_8869 [Trichinella pseudospiralis]|uniref:Uncharacterized protein n=1 Tax=Trichinella pseudospiralis TaxID=6337 RepID=A0A0V1FS83_TRIPS|nr:hypothetical protein T4D_8869 [Trichinella pseudospiralis]
MTINKQSDRSIIFNKLIIVERLRLSSSNVKRPSIREAFVITQMHPLLSKLCIGEIRIKNIAVDLRFVENDLFQLEVHKIYLLCSTILQFRKTLESTLSLFIVNAINIEMMYEVTIVDTLAYQTMENVVQFCKNYKSRYV